MKTIFLSIFLAAISYTSFAAAPGNPEEPENLVTDKANAGIDFSLWGTIGDASAEIDMNGMTGHFSYNGTFTNTKGGKTTFYLYYD